MVESLGTIILKQTDPIQVPKVKQIYFTVQCTHPPYALHMDKIALVIFYACMSPFILRNINPKWIYSYQAHMITLILPHTGEAL